MLHVVIETVNIELGSCGLVVGNFHQEGAMITPIFPIRVRPDFDPLHPSRPYFRDETVVDVKRALLFPLKVVGRLFFFPVSFAMKEMVAAHQTQLGEHLHQPAMVQIGSVI